MLTPERAKWLIENPASKFGNLRYAFDHDHLHPAGCSVLPQFEDGITVEEDNYIKLVWSMMGGEASYFTALYYIAEG